ncbi:SagB/ThcOx family dehydrogenase [Bacillus gobiensis]|uniref:SagB/ThcOx family dehydrogenase n=1 Tax=Bacillus gobiensis TaxID=1441095 RepID=UPI003D1A9B9F
MRDRFLRIPLGLSVIHAPFKGNSNQVVINNTIDIKFFDSEMLEQPLFLFILKYCQHEISQQNLVELMTEEFEIEKDEAKTLIEKLIDNCILIDIHSPKYQGIVQLGVKWVEKGWQTPLIYHLHTNNIEKDDYWIDPLGLDDRKEMEQKVKESPIPPIYKLYEGLPSIQLEIPNEYKLSITSVFNDVLGEDKQRNSMQFEEFSRLMYFAFGQTGIKVDSVTGKHISKTSPSGGARHPSETYVFVHDVIGISPGLYHYNVKDHSLILISEGDFRKFVQQNIILHKDRPSFNFKVTFVHTLIFERSMHRYRESRSFRPVNHDLGHVMQTVALLASSLNRNSYRGYSLIDQAVENLLNIDGITESTMTYTLVG